MANQAGSAGAGVRLDDFVGAVHADPAKVEARKLISGFVGHGDGDGKLRVYSDPSLSQWTEISASDVVHSRPIADSPLGGSHIWLKSGAELKPGSIAPPSPATPMGGLGGDTGVFNPFTTIHPTIWTQLPPCGPVHNTLATLCTQVGVCATAPTHGLGCPGTVTCPPHISLATICTHAVSCMVAPTHGFGCPSSITCPPSHNLGCPVTATCAPSHHINCNQPATGVPGCPPPFTLNQGSPVEMAAVAAPTHGFGCPNTSTCTPHTLNLGCPGTSTCTPVTHLLGCPNTSTCAPQQQGAVLPPTIGFVCLPTLPQHCLPITLPHMC